MRDERLKEAREISQLFFLLSYSTSQLRKSSNDKDEPLSANKANASRQNISNCSSKYKSDSKEQHTKEEGIAKWIERAGLLVTKTEDEDCFSCDGDRVCLIVWGE